MGREPSIRPERVMQVSMNRVDLTISFPDINVRTSELCGKQACGITVARIVDGRPQRSDQLIFAYRAGIPGKRPFSRRNVADSVWN